MMEPGSAEWHDRRRNGIGASEIAAACGISRWKSRYELWQEKKGLRAPFGGNEATLWGQRNERHIIEDWCDRFEAKLIATQQEFRHPDWPHLWATVDAIVQLPDGSKSILEAKCTTSRNSELGLDGTDEVPLEWLGQVSIQMLLSGIERAEVAVLVDGNKSRHYAVPFNRAGAVEIAILASSWFEECLATEVPPQIWCEKSQMVDRLWDHGIDRIADVRETEIPNLWAQYEDLGRQIKELNEERDRIKAEAVVAMGDHRRVLIAADRELVIEKRTRAAYTVKAAFYTQLTAKKVK